MIAFLKAIQPSPGQVIWLTVSIFALFGPWGAHIAAFNFIIGIGVINLMEATLVIAEDDHRIMADIIENQKATNQAQADTINILREKLSR